MKSKKIRVTIDLNQDAHTRLASMVIEREAATKAEVIREALNLYYYMTRRAMAGCEFRLVEDGEIKKVPFLPAPDRVS